MIENDEELRVSSFDKMSDIFQTKVFKKYKVVFGIIGFGFFLGGPVQMGVLGGVLAGLGTYAAMERLKECRADIYNWILQNPGWVELMCMAATTGVFGLTLGGVFISLVANFTMSATLDWIAERHGVIPNTDQFSFGKAIRDTIKFVFNGTKTIAKDLSDDFKPKKEADASSIPAESRVVA
jgi:hypothetical protein